MIAETVGMWTERSIFTVLLAPTVVGGGGGGRGGWNRNHVTFGCYFFFFLQSGNFWQEDCSALMSS